jgi:hypothetical protein
VGELRGRKFRFRSSTMRQRSQVSTVPLLAQQLIPEGFVHAKPLGNLPVTANAPLHGLHNAFSQV